MTVDRNKLNQWADEYVKTERSAMRGGRRGRTKAEVREAVQKAFPAIGFWLLWWIVRLIIKRIYNGDE